MNEAGEAIETPLRARWQAGNDRAYGLILALPPLPTKPLHSSIRPRLQDVHHCGILPFGNALNPDRGERAAARLLDRLVNAEEERALKCDGNRQR